MYEPLLSISETPRRHTDPRTGCKTIDFTHCISGKLEPEQVKIILMEDDSQRLRKRKKAGKLLRAKSRLEKGCVQATMFYYDRFEKYHSLSNALAVVLTQENRAIMHKRKDDERIPLWRRETINWALEQGEAIRKCASDLKTVAEDGAEGDERRNNLEAGFNSELVPRSWNQVLDQWILNIYIGGIHFPAHPNFKKNPKSF